MAGIIQIVGAAITAIGVGLIFPPAGIILAGILTVLFGVAMERSSAE